MILSYKSELVISYNLYEEPMTKSEPIPSADKSVNYNDFMTSRINSNYSFVKTDKIESGIAQT